ncbi:MAG: M23 family metallopeptidase [Treponema sp.]|jgi:murein DD-endopeptidase MepM/ murein hydrolase activator NlpD|nr:M23 family metallopeptidase [Treponema sp.]
MALSLLNNQQVARRRRPSPVNGVGKKPIAVHKTGPFGLPGGSSGAYDNRNFVQQVKQRPVHKRHYRSNSRSNEPVFNFRKTPRPVSASPQHDHNTSTGKAGVAEPRQTQMRRPGFTIPLPSLATLTVAIGIVLFSLLAINWQGLNISLPAAQTMIPDPGTNAESGQALASYAGISPFSPAAAGIPAGEVGEAMDEIPLDLIETYSWASYKVQKGETVSQIAANFAISNDAIISVNNISNVRYLQEGQVLRIPNMDGVSYTVKRGDNLNKISRSMGVPLTAILDANDIRSDNIAQGDTLFIPGAKMAITDMRRALGELFIYPITGRLTSSYGWRNDPINNNVRSFHAAIDLAARTGTPVKAATDGTVSLVGRSPVFGTYIIMKHGDDYQTMYAHLSATSVKQGDYVRQGGKIGEVGSTGYSTGPHLHFAVYKNGRAVNPLDLLNR